MRKKDIERIWLRVKYELKEERLEIEAKKKELELKDEFKDKEMLLQKDYHDKVVNLIESFRVEMKEVYAEIIKRLPNVNMKLGEVDGYKRSSNSEKDRQEEQEA